MRQKKHWTSHYAGLALLAIFAYFLMLGTMSKAHYVDFEQVNEQHFLSCAEAPLLNPLILFTLCNIEKKVQQKFPRAKLYITATNRLLEPSFDKSQHHGGNAADFFFTIYTGRDCQDYLRYRQIILIVERFLLDSGLVSRVGVGLYVSNGSYGSKIIHLDFRGPRIPLRFAAKWAFVNVRQVGYDAGKNEIKRILLSCKKKTYRK